MGSNPQSDPRIFPEIPGFSRSLTHGLTHGVFYRPTLFACTEIPKKPEATGSAGRCDPGVGGSPTHTLSPACFSHPLCRPEPGLFPEERNPMLFRRKRRVPRTRGFLRERAVGSVPHTGPTRAFFGLGWVLSLPWEETPHTGPHGAQQAGLVFFPVVSTSELVCFVYSWAESVSSRNSRTVGGTWRS